MKVGKPSWFSSVGEVLLCGCRWFIPPSSSGLAGARRTTVSGLEGGHVALMDSVRRSLQTIGGQRFDKSPQFELSGTRPVERARNGCKHKFSAL